MLYRSCLALVVIGSAGIAQNIVPAPARPPVLLAGAPGSRPFTMEERWEHYLRRTYSPQRMGLLGVDTAIDMSLAPGNCGRSGGCFSDRFAGAFFRRSTRTTIELAAGALLNEDVRRRSSGLEGIGPRLKHSLAHAFAAYHSDGSAGPAWSRFIGAAGGIAVSSGWSGQPVCGGRMLHSFSWVIASNVQDSLLNEFGPDLKRWGMRLRDRLPLVGRP